MMKNQQSEQPKSKHEDNLGDLGSCQASMENGGKCGEVKTLEILKEFQQLYENKLNEIKDECSCTSTRIKISMLEDWVKDLTEQNTMLVQVVEELEQEASERVSLLEEKLRTSSKTSFEIMKTFQDYDAQNISNHSDVLQKLMEYQSDINNFSELITRVRNEGVWNLEGLHFYNITKEDLNVIMNVPARHLSKSTPVEKQKELEDTLDKMKCELSKSKQKLDEYERETQNKEILIRDQSEQIEKLNEVVERCSSSVPDRQNLLEELHELRKQLKLKTENYNQLELSVKDMREALTAEVADKHDNLVALRRECQLLEERCRQADKQTHFKDDIIKEMRKELKQYRSKTDHKSRKHSRGSSDKSIQVALKDLYTLFEQPQSDKCNQNHRNKSSAICNQSGDFEEPACKEFMYMKHRKVNVQKGVLQVQLENDKFRFPCHKFLEGQFDVEKRDFEKEEMKKKVTELQEENENLYKTISAANTELNVLHDLISKHYEHEESENKILIPSKKVKKSKSKNKSIFTMKSDYNFSELSVEERISCLEKFCEDLLSLARETKEQTESLQNLRNKSVQNSDNMLEISKSDLFADRFSDDFSTTILLLKSDISSMLHTTNKYGVNEFDTHVSNIENALHEVRSHEKLLKTKEEMISVQNETLSLTQKELQEISEKLMEVEKERDKKIQEVYHLQDALELNKNTIQELQKALKNTEEKASNIQQTADVYVETISLLENAKNKSEIEVEQQRVTIGNLQDALVSVKKQLEEVQAHNGAELKEKCGVIYNLYQELDEIQAQYMNCYGENVKLSQTADCLRDANLELKVFNLNLHQDIEELNAKITNDKSTITTLEGSIKKIMSANELLESDINYMKEEMGNLTSELKVLQELLKMSASCPTLEEHNSNLVKSLTILQEHSESLVGQLKLSQEQVSREIKLNDMNFGKINELQNVLDAKTQEFSEVTNKYDQSVKLNKEYENRIIELEQEIKDMKNKQSLTDLKNDENNDVSCMKEKIDLLNTILNEKSNEILHVHAALSVKADTIASLVKDNEVLVKDNKKLAQHAMNIEEQLENYKDRCNDLNEKYDKCKDELDKYLHEKVALVDKLENVRKQESLLSTKLKESSEELEKVKESIKDKDYDVNKSYTCIQEEVTYLKEEIDRLNKIRVRLLSENKKLQEQISSIKLNSAQFESHNMIVADQLQKCLEEINILQCAKQKLEEKNIELETEVEHLQTTFSDLNHEIRFKHESFINLEHELSETKCSRDEICAESRMVVSKVRAWLDEQKRINISLNEVIKEKNMVIEELSMEKTLLMKNIKDVCDRYEALSEELQLCRQYVSEINDHHPELLKLPQIKRSYTWGSQNSVGDSQTSSPVFVDETPFEELYEDNDADPNPAKWMRKVQNMSEGLLKSKKYWQTKMSQSATKRLKPVKEAVKTKSLGTTKSS